jgi:hypothetical protein
MRPMQKMTQTLARGFLSLLLAGTVTLLQGCDSTGTGSQVTNGGSGAGGAAQTGGSAQTGGAASGGSIATSGGTSAAGGGAAPKSGGVVASGGAAPSGGVTTSGGVTKTGGTTTTGGATPPPLGGTVTDGGVGAGGVTRPGGATRTGGAAPSGGVVASGGATSAGGVTGAGGATKPAAGGGTGHYQMENLDRGVVAVKVSGGVYVGWRMFGYEYTGTDSDTSYNLYKDGTKVANVTDSTNYLDAAGTSSSKYTVSCRAQRDRGAAVCLRSRLGAAIHQHPADEAGLTVQRERWQPRGSRWRRQTRHRAEVGGGHEGQFPVRHHRPSLYCGIHLGWQAALEHQPGREYSRRGTLHADVGGRLRRRRQGGILLQDRTGDQGRNRRVSEHRTRGQRR